MNSQILSDILWYHMLAVVALAIGTVIYWVYITVRKYFRHGGK